MTTNSSQSEADQLCAICEETRENHGDKQHQFSIDGQLIQKKPAEPARRQPPQTREEAAAQPLPDAHAALMRLSEVLLKKGIIDGADLMYIVGGHVVLDRG